MSATRTQLLRLLALVLLVHVIVAVPSVERTAWKRIAKPRAHRRTEELANSSSSTTTCANDNARPTTAPKQNVWDSLTDDESAAVTEWLFEQSDLNLTSASEAGDWDNTVCVCPVQNALFVVEVHIFSES